MTGDGFKPSFGQGLLLPFQSKQEGVNRPLMAYAVYHANTLLDKITMLYGNKKVCPIETFIKGIYSNHLLDKICEWCNQLKKITVHHVKNRLGDKEEIYQYKKHLIFVTIDVCRKCHNEIERDYELIGKVIQVGEYVRENTLEGIQHNIYVRMANLHNEDPRMVKIWLEKKIRGVHGRMLSDKSCKIGLYNSVQLNRHPYRMLIMTLAIALNDLRYLHPKVF